MEKYLVFYQQTSWVLQLAVNMSVTEHVTSVMGKISAHVIQVLRILQTLCTDALHHVYSPTSFSLEPDPYIGLDLGSGLAANFGLLYHFHKRGFR